MAALVVAKKVKNAILYTNGCVKLENVRFSFPHIAEPKAGESEDGKPTKAKFGVVSMLPKATHKEAKELLKEAILKLLASNQNAKVALDKWCLRNGDDMDREEYMGHFIVSAREERRPSVRNKRGEPVVEKDEIADMFYGGCWGSVLIRPWYQDGQKVGKGYGKRVNAGLVGVQFVRSGDPFGEGRIDDTDAWDSVDDDGSDGFEDGDEI